MGKEDLSSKLKSDLRTAVREIRKTGPLSTRQETRLVTSLSRVVDESIGSTIQPEELNITYELKIGPILKDGKSYTTREILDMPAYDFIMLHRSISGAQNVASRYFKSAASRILENRSQGSVSVREAIAIPLDEATKLQNVKARVITQLDGFLRKNYGIGLGMKY